MRGDGIYPRVTRALLDAFLVALDPEGDCFR